LLCAYNLQSSTNKECMEIITLQQHCIRRKDIKEILNTIKEIGVNNSNLNR